ncbi:MAG: hypothetical protein NT139_01070, partial [Candidatus Woesearchaeota archaeon]|nr:hypothetical protein [Candidatus Woesearchaeota archaeon]
KILLFPVIILGLYFIYRLIDQSQIINHFPLDYTNDISFHITMLFFLAKYGYNALVPNWYNGFILFKIYQPGWYIYTLPIYLITKNILLATYISLISLFVIGLISLFIIGKNNNFSLTKILAFFVFFFAIATNLGNWTRLGRVTELFGWISFIALAAIVLYYKDRPLDKKFPFLFIPIYFITIISHFSETIVSQFLVLMLFLIKSKKEKYLLILYTTIGLILSSFWWLPFILNAFKLSISSDPAYFYILRLLDFGPQWILRNIASFIIPPLLWFTFYNYWKYQNKSKKELIFISPILILSIIFITRLIIIIPFLNRVYPDAHMNLYLFFGILYFLKTPFNFYSKKIKYLIVTALILLSILSVSINILHTPLFKIPGKLENDTISVLQKVDNKYLIVETPETIKTSFSRAYYCYGAVYYNLSTPSGFVDLVKEIDYNRITNSIPLYVKNKNCKDIIKALKSLNTTEILTYDDYCNNLKSCNLKQKIKQDRVCLYSI